MAHDMRGWEGCPKCGYMGGMGGWRFVKWDTGEDGFAIQQTLHVLREANKKLNREIIRLRTENEALRQRHPFTKDAPTFEPVVLHE